MSAQPPAAPEVPAPPRPGPGPAVQEARPARIAPVAALAASGPRRQILVGIGLAAILAVFAARAADVARTDSITSDETTHLIRTLHYWRTGDDLVMWELGAPRLPHLLAGLASYLALEPAGLIPPEPTEASIEAVVVSGNPRVLLPARAVAIAWGVALLLGVFWAAARTHGGGIGLAAAGIASLVPECLAHAAIAGSDVPFAAAALLCLILMARYLERPTARRWAGVALAVGLAWAMRHSALLLLPLAGGVRLWSDLRRGAAEDRPILDRLAATARGGLALGLVAFLVLWAGDGFGAPSLAEVADRTTALRPPERVGPFSADSIRVPSSLLSVVKQVRHQAAGHEAFFLGERGETGWAAYFPVAFALKTPIGLLLLLAIAAARVRPRATLEVLALACLALLWVMLLRNRVNIGVRYALLTYPLAAPFVARLFAPAMLRDRLWGPLTVAGLVLLAVAGVSAHPRYLSYFNEAGGGPSRGWLHLADSNVDWGQDFEALARALPRLGIDEVTYDLSTERRLEVPGVRAVWNPPRSQVVPFEAPPNRRIYDADGTFAPVTTRYFAASVTRLHGLYSQNDLSWLRTRRLVARVGDSVFLFDMDLPAEAPLADSEAGR